MSDNEIFVFGSNQAGRHGAGAALAARNKHGAVYGRGSGPQGRSYAIPTKGFDMEPLPIGHVKMYIDEFIVYAGAHPELIFQVTRVGCGLAGFTDKQIAPLFLLASDNCRLAPTWRAIIRNLRDKSRSGSSSTPAVV